MIRLKLKGERSQKVRKRAEEKIKRRKEAGSRTEEEREREQENCYRRGRRDRKSSQ